MFFDFNSATGEIAKNTRLVATLGCTKTLAKVIKNCEMLGFKEGRQVFLDTVKYLTGGEILSFAHSKPDDIQATLVFANGGCNYLLDALYHCISCDIDAKNLIVIDQRQYNIIGRHEAWLHNYGISLLPVYYRPSDSSVKWTPYSDSWTEIKQILENTLSYAPCAWVWLCTRSPMCTQREFEIDNGIAASMVELANALPTVPLIKVIDFEGVEDSLHRVRNLNFQRDMTIGQMRSFLNHEED